MDLDNGLKKIGKQFHTSKLLNPVVNNGSAFTSSAFIASLPSEVSYAKHDPLTSFEIVFRAG